jgi:hypothetical protein
MKDNSNEVSGIAFVGSILVGIGLGMLYGRTGVGALLGIGAGFILMATIKALVSSKHR